MSQKGQEGAAKQNVPKPELTPVPQTLETEGQIAQSAAALRRISGAPAESLSSRDVLALQRTVGNQVVQRTLAMVGTGGEGVQAVQRSGTGIAKGETIDEFGKGVKGMESEWAKLSTEERANKMVALANKALATVNVPAIAVKIGALKGRGLFDNTSWTMGVDQTIISKDSLTVNEMGKLADTFYHEARHAEQYFRVARWMAGEGKSAGYIARELAIPGRIAKAAWNDPLDPIHPLEELLEINKDRAKDIAEAKAWAKSLGRAGTRKYKKIIKELHDSEKALEAATAAYRQSATKENKEKLKEARETYKKKFKTYRNLVEEKDAWKVGDDAFGAYWKAGGEGVGEGVEND
jgi:hypothetical protein